MSGIRVEIDMGDRTAEFTMSYLQIAGRTAAAEVDAAERTFNKMSTEIRAWFAAARETVEKPGRAKEERG